MIPERLSKKHLSSFIAFFERLRQDGAEDFFHPHPYTPKSLEEVIRLSEEGVDEYWVGLRGSEIAQYGLLRGWQEGYTRPSLGIAVAPGYRGLGLARALMVYLHQRAIARGAMEIILKVNRRNQTAIKLYLALGYKLDEGDSQNLIGKLNLTVPESKL